MRNHKDYEYAYRIRIYDRPGLMPTEMRFEYSYEGFAEVQGWLRAQAENIDAWCEYDIARICVNDRRKKSYKIGSGFGRFVRWQDDFRYGR